MNTINTETITKWIYEAARIDAEIHQRPIVPEMWEQRDEKFRKQMVAYVSSLLILDKLPTPEEAHDSWVKAYEKMGWKFGETRNVEKKAHPDMLPFDQLHKAERDKDEIFLALVTVGKTLLRLASEKY